MGRMLQALQRIEAKPAHQPEHGEPSADVSRDIDPPSLENATRLIELACSPEPAFAAEPSGSSPDAHHAPNADLLESESDGPSGTPRSEQPVEVSAALPPTYEPPTYDAPTYDAPTYEPPTYDAPTYDSPTYDAPTYDAPTCKPPPCEPSIDEPSIDEPAEHGELARNVLKHLSADRGIIMVTSPGDREGKTSILASLAPALAREVSGEVLAMDADFRAPGLAGRFGVWDDRGLVEVLLGMADWTEVVRKTSLDNLSILPGGRIPSDDGSLPDDVQFAPLFDSLRRRFQVTLVDSSSLAYADVASLSHFCDGTLLAVRLGRTSRRAVRRAIRAIENSGGRVLGCVLVGVK